MQLKTKGKMSIWRYLTLGYLIVILSGSVLLMLPFATKDGQTTSYINALFTATSAACVTGLVPFDTFTHWTLFGQIVILLLIQLGGLGFTTFVSILFIMVKRGFGLYERSAVSKSLGSNSLKGVKTLVKQIVIGTLIFETIGAGLLSVRFIPDFGTGRGIYFSVFHAVSAFCNAGFDLMGTAGSLTAYAEDPLVVITICALIFIGGLGFCVWGDIFNCRANPKKFQFYTKFILFCSFVLLAVSTGLFLAFDWNVGYADKDWGGKILCALFNAATARTAGFYTVDYNLLSESGYMLTIILMFIGGCSGSTAGGIKVGTFAVIIMGMMAALRGKQDINLGKRRVDISQLHQALAVFTAYLTIILLAVMTICAIEPYEFKKILFETVSALGTVGLSMSLTPMLSIASKIILILLMFAGRAGVLTIAMALGRKNKSEAQIRRPVEVIFIG